MSATGIDASRAPLLTHLVELRRRLLRCLLVFALAFSIAYQFADVIYAFLTSPLADAMDEQAAGIDRRMIYTGLHEAFFTFVKLALFAALFVSLPMMLNQVWKFLAPGMYAHERKSLLPAFFATPVLFVLGAALAFYGVFPLAWGFFLSFESIGVDGGLPIELEARVSEYLALVIRLIFAFGLSFQLPIVLLILARVGVVTADTLREYRRHAIVLAFVAAALVTPPDLISQIALGMPIVVLYELAILLIRHTEADREGKQRAEVRDSKIA